MTGLRRNGARLAPDLGPGGSDSVVVGSRAYSIPAGSVVALKAKGALAYVHTPTGQVLAFTESGRIIVSTPLAAMVRTQVFKA